MLLLHQAVLVSHVGLARAYGAKIVKVNAYAYSPSARVAASLIKQILKAQTEKNVNQRFFPQSERKAGNHVMRAG